ncbi:MAG: radical SAM protein, partial [Nitrospina sp.]|nr:radical SAM protein [Nitrospina sp.]
DLLDEQEGVVHICTQRGCPFPCSYCAAASTLELYDGNEYGRRRSCQNVIDELVDIKKNGSLNFVIFEDDTFTIDRKWVRKFCRQFKETIGVGFSLNARVETMTLEMIEELAAAGCQFIVYGVESGSYRVRKNIMNRPVTNERFLEVFNWSKHFGIRIIANFMLGVPGETKQDIDMTLGFIKELEPDDFSYSVFYPFPGTALLRLCLDKGYLPKNYLDLPANHRQSILNLPDLTQEDIAEYYGRFTEAREKNYLRQYGNLLNYETQKLAINSIKECAALG